ncbi:unnamed protein product [Spodoptera littoralis]|uniref:G-protein coupled receptors family 1 profile domain-containing protein n=1 Tax=Spodoptera littoralis TaxID=7109 RepID=A0A9P0I4H9_SPOLI|nr:unnamed protein product [Spodoptera littoralis]CAH1639284.1 unnamed protein product [Spodoptera littoralis]
MDESDFDDLDSRFVSNWSEDYLEQLDTSQHNFPNTLWHVKPPVEIVLKSSAMLIIGITGIFLNSIILIILFRNKWLWTASNYLVGNLALIDLLTLLICPWFMLVRDFYQQYVLRNFGCRFEGFLQASFLLAGVCAVLLVSYDRLAAAALAADTRVTIKVAPYLIVASWIMSMIVSLPWAVKREFVERQWKNYVEMFCIEDSKVLGIYWHFLLMLLVWVPLGVMVVTYAIIMWRLEWSVRELASRGGGQSIARARTRTLRITACVLLTSLICRMPFTAFIYWRNNLPNEVNSADGGFQIMWFASNYLLYLNCAINPLIYGFTNARFRKAMDRTPGVACFKFGSWCCLCDVPAKKHDQGQEKNTEKIFVIAHSPKPHKKISKAIKNILHIKKDTLEFSIKVDEVTTKPTKITPVKTEPVLDNGKI